MTLEVEDIEQLPRAAQKLLDFAANAKVFLFYGDMGAGKTTFIKAICGQLQVADITSSPTFSIVNEYDSPSGPVFHFDFYRLKTETEALDLGYEDYIDSGSYCFIEWPEKIKTFLPDKAVEVYITISDKNSREIIARHKP